MPVWVAGAGSGGRFRKVPDGSGVCWCRFRRQLRKVPVPACVGVGSGGRVRKVPVPACVGVGSGGRVQKVLESSGVVCCLATLTGAAM